MAIVHVHLGGGCEAITRTEGNELWDWQIHQFYCEKEATRLVFFEGGFSKRACSDHAEYWKRNWPEGVTVQILEIREDD